MEHVVIGMDPHKRSVTIEVMTGTEQVLAKHRFETTAGGFRQLLSYAKQWPDRLWAVEGCNGIGRHVASRLVMAGETVVDVPPKLSARLRMFDTRQGRKTDPDDAHEIAMVAVRMNGLRSVVNDERQALLRILADRRRALGEDHTRMISQVHQLLLELSPPPSMTRPSSPRSARRRSAPPSVLDGSGEWKVREYGSFYTATMDDADFIRLVQADNWPIARYRKAPEEKFRRFPKPRDD